MKTHFLDVWRSRCLAAGSLALALTTASLPANAQSPNATTTQENSWKAFTVQTPQAPVCSVGVRTGEIVVGFAAVNGDEFLGFVSGLIDKAKRSTWRVDDAQPFVVDGAKSAQGSWLTEPLPAELLAHVTDGRELAITSADGERIIVSLKNAADAVASFNDCRYLGQSRSNNAPKPTTGVITTIEAFNRAAGTHYSCAFRDSEAIGLELPRGMMSDEAYVRSLEVNHIAITFDAENERFVLGDRMVESVAFIQPGGKFPEGAATMAYSDFATTLSLTSAAAAARGLTADEQRQLQTIMKQFSGGITKKIAPSRKVVFDAADGGVLNFFDLSASGDPVNFSSVICDRQ